MLQIDYNQSKAVIKEYAANMAEVINERYMIPETFYMSHTDYTPEEGSFAMKHELIADIQNCLKMHPKLIYPLLAVVSALFLNDNDTPVLFYYFNTPEEKSREFIQTLVEAFYGRVDNGMMQIPVKTSYPYKNFIEHKAFLWDRFQFNGIFQEKRLLQEHVRKEEITLDLGYDTFHNNAVIMTSDDPAKILEYNNTIRKNMVYFNTRLLEPGVGTEALGRFKLNCILQPYHHILNINDHNWKECLNSYTKDIEYSFELSELIDRYPYLQNQARALYAAAKMIRDMFNISVRNKDVEKMIMGNFKLFQQVEMLTEVWEKDGVSYWSWYRRPVHKAVYKKIKTSNEISPIAEIHIPVESFVGMLNIEACKEQLPKACNHRMRNGVKYILQRMMNLGVIKMDGKKPAVSKYTISDKESDCYTLYFMDGDITMN